MKTCRVAVVGLGRMGSTIGISIANACAASDRLDEDPNATYRIRFANGVGAWAVPAGPRDFEIIGAAGPRRTETLTPEEPSEMTTVICLEDLLDTRESGRKTRGDMVVAHNLTEACLAVAESPRLGGAWVDLPRENRDLYVFHV